MGKNKQTNRIQKARVFKDFADYLWNKLTTNLTEVSKVPTVAAMAGYLGGAPQAEVCAAELLDICVASGGMKKNKHSADGLSRLSVLFD